MQISIYLFFSFLLLKQVKLVSTYGFSNNGSKINMDSLIEIGISDLGFSSFSEIITINDGYMLIWNNNSNIYARIYKNNSNFEVQINILTHSDDIPKIASYQHNIICIIWSQTNENKKNSSIFGRIYNTIENKFGSEFLITNNSLEEKQKRGDIISYDLYFIFFYINKGFKSIVIDFNGKIESINENINLSENNMENEFIISGFNLNNNGFVLAYYTEFSEIQIECFDKDINSIGYHSFFTNNYDQNAFSFFLKKEGFVFLYSENTIQIYEYDNNCQEIKGTSLLPSYNNFELILKSFSPSGFAINDDEYIITYINKYETHEKIFIQRFNSKFFEQISSPFEFDLDINKSKTKISVLGLENNNLFFVFSIYSDSLTKIFGMNLNLSPSSSIPYLINNDIFLENSGKIYLTTDNFKANDLSDINSIHFLIEDVKNTEFNNYSFFQNELIPNTESYSFIYFKFNISAPLPSFNITVSNGINKISKSPVNIYLFQTNFDIYKNQKLILTPEILNISNSNGIITDIIFFIEFNENCDFFNIEGKRIFNFTYNEMSHSKIRLIVKEKTPIIFFKIVFNYKQKTITHKSYASLNYKKDRLKKNNFTSIRGQTTQITINMIDYLMNPGNFEGRFLKIDIQNLRYGSFLNKKGEIITKFFLADIDEGTIFFSHDGSDNCPSFSFSSTDGEIHEAKIYLIDVTMIIHRNEKIKVKKDFLIIKKGNEIMKDLKFQISNEKNGIFNFQESKIIPFDEFNENDIELKQLVYRHDGSANYPVFDIKIYNSEGMYLEFKDFEIKLSSTNSTIYHNKMIIKKGETINFNNEIIELITINSDFINRFIIVNILEIKYGTLLIEKEENTYEIINHFILEELSIRKIVFKHDNSSNVPSISFQNSEDYKFNLISYLIIENFTISRGQIQFFIPRILTIKSQDNYNHFSFEVSQTQSINFYHKNNSDIPISNFHQKNMEKSEILVEHDSSKKPPIFILKIYKDYNEIHSYSPEIKFFLEPLKTNYSILNNKFILQKGGFCIMNSHNIELSTNNFTFENRFLKISFPSIKHGKFYHKSNLFNNINSFFLIELSNNNIFFEHDSSENLPIIKFETSEYDKIDINTEFINFEPLILTTQNILNSLLSYSIYFYILFAFIFLIFIIIIIRKIIRIYKNRNVDSSFEKIIKDTKYVELEIENTQQQVFIDYPELNIDWLKCIGQGNYGSSYIANYKNTLVVAKELNLSRLNDEINYEQFLININKYKKIKSDKILGIIGICINELNNKYIILLKYMKNGSLLNVQKLPDFTLKRKLQIGRDIISGLEIIYSNNMVHGNLKPENILLNEKLNIVLTDIKLYNLENLFEKVNPYKAPELYENNNISIKSDIFAFGVIFFELLSNKRIDWNYKLPEINIENEIMSVLENKVPIACINLIVNCCKYDENNRKSLPEILKEINSIIQNIK